MSEFPVGETGSVLPVAAPEESILHETKRRKRPYGEVRTITRQDSHYPELLQESTSVFQTHNSNERRVWNTLVCSRWGFKTSGIVHTVFGMTDGIFGIVQVSFGVTEIVFGRAYRGFGASDGAFGVGYVTFGAAKKGYLDMPCNA